MNGLLLLVAVTAPSVDVGWQPLAGGGYEYIIQIEPENLAAMQQGRDVVSDLPPELRNIRRYRITIGSGPLPRIGTPPEVSDPSVLEGDPRLQPRNPAFPASPSANDSMVRDNRTGGTTTDRYGSTTNDPYGTGNIGMSDPRLGAATGIGAPPASRFPSNNGATDPYGTNNSSNYPAGNNGYAADPRLTGNYQPANNYPANNNLPANNNNSYGNDPFNNGYGQNPLNTADARNSMGYNDPRMNANAGQYPANNGMHNNGMNNNGMNNPGMNGMNTNGMNNNGMNPSGMNPSGMNPGMNNGMNNGGMNNGNMNTWPANQGTGMPSNFNNGANNGASNWPTNTANPAPIPTAQNNFTGTEVPKPFLDDDGLRRASFHSGAEGENGKTTSPVEDVKPWFPFTMALLMLFVSLGGNAYLGWITLTLRSKYMALLERLRRKFRL